MNDDDCTRCGHPAEHHDAGECWTDSQGREVFDDVDDQCECSWYTPASEAKP